MRWYFTECAKAGAVIAALWIGQLRTASCVCVEGVKTRDSCCQDSLCPSQDVKSKSGRLSDAIEGQRGSAQSVKDRRVWTSCCITVDIETTALRRCGVHRNERLAQSVTGVEHLCCRVTESGARPAVREKEISQVTAGV